MQTSLASQIDLAYIRGMGCSVQRRRKEMVDYKASQMARAAAAAALVERSYYNPTPTQRAELRFAAEVMRQRLAKRRREREALDAFRRIGFDDKAASELAAIQIVLQEAAE
jgi:predicted nucleic acid-binding protein